MADPQNPELTKQHLKTIIFRSYYLYLEKHHPDVDFAALCSEAGLSVDYVMDDNNWVSIEFERRLMAAIHDKVQDPDLLRKVGAYGVKRDVLGWPIHFLAYNVLSLETLYENLPFMTGLLNKVMRAELQTKGERRAVIKISPILEGLTESEKSVLLRRMPDFISNTVGYYSAIPTEKKLAPAEVRFEHFENQGIPSYYVEVRYPKEKFTISKLAKWLSLASGIMAGLITWSDSQGIARSLSVGVFVAVVIEYFRGRVLLRSSRLMAEQTRDTLTRLDKQYKVIQDAQASLKIKLGESTALNHLVNSLISAKGEQEILDLTSRSLVASLGYDRAVVLMSDTLGHALSYKSSFGVEERMKDIFAEMTIGIHIPSADPQKISNVFRTGVPILITDVKTHLETLTDEQSVAILKTSESKSFVAVPIRTAEKTYGILMADCYKRDKVMTESDMILLTTVGRQLALSVARERSKRELEVSMQNIGKLADSYSRFVPWETLEYLNYNTIFDVNLGDGTEKFMTILFSDIRDFTKLCETMSPIDILRFLNSFYGKLSPIIKKHGGTIDKFIGDCVMAIFTDPISAIQAGLEIQREIIKYNLAERTGRTFVQVGVGICHGPVVIGPLGFDRKLEITVISDTVNIASRLDGLCKELNAKILIAGIEPRTLRLPEGVHFNVVGDKTVKGKDTPIRVTEIVDLEILSSLDPAETPVEGRSYIESLKSYVAEKKVMLSGARKSA